MASELRRPPTRTGSGSRPPTSRFQEGSMNDRTSAAPPAQFLGPEQLKIYETQFYAERPTTRESRRRPFSASGQLQAAPPSQHADMQPPKHTVTHKKSMGFFGRVKDALFHRDRGGPTAPKPQADAHRKHSSLQEPLQNPSMPPPPRPNYLQQAGRTQSEINIAQMFPEPRVGAIGERPSREDVLASYNQLMASGFFQSHAIQSTRHAAPTGTTPSGAGMGGRQPPMAPTDQNDKPRSRPPLRLSSLRAAARAGSASPMPSPNRTDRNSRDYAAPSMAPPAAPRTSLSSLFRPSIPDLHTKDSRYALRGRKRTRGDETPVVTPEPQASSSTSYFTQPLKRVAKKLRSSSQLNEKDNAKNNTTVHTTQQPGYFDQASADGMTRLVPSVSNGGSLHPNERPIRLRSPSPAMPDMMTSGQTEWTSARPVREPVISAATRARRPRKTFSYTVTETARGRTRAAEREREREMRAQLQLQQRGSSGTRADDDDSRVPPRSTRQTTPSRNPLGQWQRVSVEDTIIHRDSADSTRSQWDWEWEQREAAEVRIASNPRPNKLRKRPAHSPSPLRSVADANRSMPLTPERWHHSGKAYHLKDRGSRPDLAVRPSEDSGKDCGKENDWRHVDADGDIDILGYENRRPRQMHHQQELHQWRIGNAL